VLQIISINHHHRQPECLRSPLQEEARGREKEHHQVYILPERALSSAHTTAPSIAHSTETTAQSIPHSSETTAPLNALHWDYHKLTPHRPFKCNQRRTSMSTCYRISKALSDGTHNPRTTPVASLSSPCSSDCPTISHWWVYKSRLNLHRMHPSPAQAEDHHSQDQEHNRAIGTHVWTILHAQLCQPSLLYPIHQRLLTLHLCFGPPR